MRTNAVAVLSLAVASAAMACGKGEVRVDSAARGAPQGAVTEAAGALAIRREPQADLDRARKAILEDDTTGAAQGLGMAAAMLREHAELPATAAKHELMAVAAALDSVGADVSAGRVNERALDLVLVRVNLVEAEHHRSQAAVAWSQRQDKTTGEELVMAADHFDRAMRDARRHTRATKSAVAKALDVGGRIATDKAFKDWEVNTSLATLGRAIRDQAGP